MSESTPQAIWAVQFRDFAFNVHYADWLYSDSFSEYERPSDEELDAMLISGEIRRMFNKEVLKP